MLLSTRAARYAALMAEPDELYPGVNRHLVSNAAFYNTNIFWILVFQKGYFIHVIQEPYQKHP